MNDIRTLEERATKAIAKLKGQPKSGAADVDLLQELRDARRKDLAEVDEIIEKLTPLVEG